MRRVLFYGIVACILSGTWIETPIYARNTGGVPGPIIPQNHQSVQYRYAFDPDNGRMATRLHYQQTISEKLMPRLVVQAFENTEGNTDWDYVQAELFMNVIDGDFYKSGFRFDYRYVLDNRPDQVFMYWTNEFILGPNTSARASFLVSKSIGERAKNKLLTGFRSQFHHWHDEVLGYGVETYSNFGSFSGSFDEQSHQVGPHISIRANEHIHLFSGVLFGLSDQADDTNYRFWTTYII